uniref:ethanolamine-phosphate cytidylyltransferase n=1 Tax=Phaeomonas parva TaxID=124430 RepID=A0A7S1U274_9STRA|mmetsp:Transcript_25565/g.80029  ORF Transcript_25565/g.80029 Transcript_25565/m.80029 type:complete len:486 (+) Transcript_25565:88-1545(+)
MSSSGRRDFGIGVGLGIVLGSGGALAVAAYRGRRRQRPNPSDQGSRSNSRDLRRDLELARARVADLEEALAQQQVVVASVPRGVKRKPVRIWMDGAFDMMHYGHMNAFRQGRALGDWLVVGVNDSASITMCKGPPVMSDAERLTTVQGCRFVDEVVPECPYIMNDAYLRHIIETYKIDYVVHGDDPCIVDGKDVYETAQKLGKYRTIPRTEGVSTTDIVGRMLLMSRSHHRSFDASQNGGDADRGRSPVAGDGHSVASEGKNGDAPQRRKSNFLTTSHMLRLFSAHVVPPNATDEVVYIDGSWDLFHAGHVRVLAKARELGDYLVVGVHSDEVVNAEEGLNFPIMNLHERVLSVLSCKYVDDVLIDAPWIITREVIASMNIKHVIRGRKNGGASPGILRTDPGDVDPYRVPKDLGIFTEVDMTNEINLNVREVCRRIAKHQELFDKKIERKKKAEQDYYDNRYGFGGGDGDGDGGDGGGDDAKAD